MKSALHNSLQAAKTAENNAATQRSAPDQPRQKEKATLKIEKICFSPKVSIQPYWRKSDSARRGAI